MKLKEKTFIINNSLKLMNKCCFIFRTLEEAEKIANLLAIATPNPEETFLGLSELMFNAIEHGNLGITCEEKSELVNSGMLQSEISRRLNSKEVKELYAEVKFEKKKDLIKIVIKDSGKGFDWEKFMDVSLERICCPNGRGIAIAKSMSFDKVEFKGSGNTVECYIFL